ncbi:peptidoglycan-binding protein, partial [Escherichia coli]|nr:peptidoglycan-binding protein [Escherichia coli]
LVASLQRALNARGYHAPISGVMDDATRQAVRRYQAGQGLDSADLSLDTARKLGLVAYPR